MIIGLIKNGVTVIPPIKSIKFPENPDPMQSMDGSNPYPTLS